MTLTTHLLVLPTKVCSQQKKESTNKSVIFLFLEKVSKLENCCFFVVCYVRFTFLKETPELTERRVVVKME